MHSIRSPLSNWRGVGGEAVGVSSFILHRGAFGGDGEADLGTLDEGEVGTGMTYGEAVDHGDGIVLQVVVEHVVHIVEIVLGTLVVGEMTYDDGLETLQDASHLEQMEHAVDLGHLLDYDSIFHQPF